MVTVNGRATLRYWAAQRRGFRAWPGGTYYHVEEACPLAAFRVDIGESQGGCPAVTIYEVKRRRLAPCPMCAEREASRG